MRRFVKVVVLWLIEVAAFREFLDWLRPMAGKFQFSQNYMGELSKLESHAIQIKSEFQGI